MERAELLKNNAYWVTKIQIDLYNQLLDYMRYNNLNKTRLAEKLGFTKSYITQVLNGDFNHRISKLVELSLAIGKVPVIEYQDLESYIKDDEIGCTRLSAKFVHNSINLTNYFPINIEDYYKENRKETRTDLKIEDENVSNSPNSILISNIILS